MSHEDPADVDDREAFFIFNSVTHGRPINLALFSTFIDEELSNPNGEYYHIERNKNHFEEIARGRNIWDRTKAETQPVRIEVLHFYGPFFSNNQGVERANKDQNMASANQREETNTSIRMIATSRLKEISR